LYNNIFIDFIFSIMKILSIDVGIKNLAYCLFFLSDAHKEEKTYTVDSWDVIDICETDEKPPCFHKDCTRDVKYYRDGIYYCKLHSRKSTYKIPKRDTSVKYLASKRMAVIKDFCANHEVNVEGCKKKDDYVSCIKKYIDEQFLYSIGEKNANSMGLVDLGKNIMTRFDTLFSKHSIDIVLIENQISPLANRMKTLQGMISQYFIMRGVQQIDFISAKNKLKRFIGSGKTSYSERKKKSIAVMNELFLSTPLIYLWEPIFNKHKKKDDLADCFLQGLWFLEEKNYVSQNNITA